MSSEGLAGAEGFEPPTHGFGDHCSTWLSYTPKGREIVPRDYQSEQSLRLDLEELPSIRMNH